MLTSVFLQVVLSPDTLNVATAAITPIAEPVIQTETLTLFELLKSGGPLMYPLYVLSVAAIYILIERIFALRKAAKVDDNFMRQIKDFISNGKIDAAKSLCASTDSPYARMIEKGLMRLEGKDYIVNDGDVIEVRHG